MFSADGRGDVGAGITILSLGQTDHGPVLITPHLVGIYFSKKSLRCSLSLLSLGHIVFYTSVQSCHLAKCFHTLHCVFEGAATVVYSRSTLALSLNDNFVLEFSLPFFHHTILSAESKPVRLSCNRIDL